MHNTLILEVLCVCCFVVIMNRTAFGKPVCCGGAGRCIKSLVCLKCMETNDNKRHNKYHRGVRGVPVFVSGHFCLYRTMMKCESGNEHRVSPHTNPCGQADAHQSPVGVGSVTSAPWTNRAAPVRLKPDIRSIRADWCSHKCEAVCHNLFGEFEAVCRKLEHTEQSKGNREYRK